MATQWLRRAWLAAAGASVLLLAACGGGDVVSAFTPSRIVVFGDGMADIGQGATGRRYTVNDGSVNNWTLQVARTYGLGLAPARAGGNSYAQGNARVLSATGAGGDATARPVKAQVDAFLAAGSFAEGDLVLVNAGHSDLIVQGRAVIEGTQTQADAVTAAGSAGTELGRQVRRMVDAGARHVVVAGAYNLGRSPWAKQTAQESMLEAISTEFNIKLKVELADLGGTNAVLYIDLPNQVNLYEGNPGNYGFTNVDAPVCNSRDPGEGIGTGTNQVDSSECTKATVVNASYDSYLFADRVYLTPRAHRNLGDFAVGRIRERW
jgi:outer membrane lipase/esterase